MNEDTSSDGAIRLRSPEDAARFINSASEDNNVDTLLYAFQQVAREHGISRVAEASGLSRESLYRSLSKGGNPGIRSLHRVLHALGMRLQVLPANVPPIFTNEEYKIMNQPGFSGGTPDTSMLLPFLKEEVSAMMHHTQEEIASLVRSAEVSIASAITAARSEPDSPQAPPPGVVLGATTGNTPQFLSALTDPNEIEAAFDTMAGALKQNAQQFEPFISWPGGREGRIIPVYWHQQAKLWSLAQAFQTEHPGYWFGLGTENPAGRKQMAPDVQIGMIGSGTYLRVAGVFARDDDGRVYVTHSGRFQVGHQPSNADAFLQAHPHQAVATVRWPNGKKRNHIVIADINDSKLVSEVSAFVHTVKAYKETLRGQ